jgi:hypothetical protein
MGSTARNIARDLVFGESFSLGDEPLQGGREIRPGKDLDLDATNILAAPAAVFCGRSLSGC